MLLEAYKALQGNVTIPWRRKSYDFQERKERCTIWISNERIPNEWISNEWISNYN